MVEHKHTHMHAQAARHEREGDITSQKEKISRGKSISLKKGYLSEDEEVGFPWQPFCQD